MNEAKYVRAVVFGKTGCDKCAVLKKRVDAFVQKECADNVECVYVDVETVDGLVAFCRAECLNPQRIPALMMEAWNPEKKRYAPITRTGPESEPSDSLRLHRILGLQTDYSDQGRGVIPPRAIREEIRLSLQSVNALEPLPR